MHRVSRVCTNAFFRVFINGCLAAGSTEVVGFPCKLKSISIFNYLDYSPVIFDNVFKTESLIALTATAIELLIIGKWIFEKKDTPT